MLKLEFPLGVAPSVQLYADAVKRLSHGSLALQIVSGYSNDPRTQEHLIADVQKGKVQLAWVFTNTWENVGIDSFRLSSDAGHKRNRRAEVRFRNQRDRQRSTCQQCAYVEGVTEQSVTTEKITAQPPGVMPATAQECSKLDGWICHLCNLAVVIR